MRPRVRQRGRGRRASDDFRSCDFGDRRLRLFSARRARAPHPARSVQNAVDQGIRRPRLVGKPKPYNELAWFWSDQGDFKLMIAGLAHGVDEWVVRGDPATRAFSTFGFRNGKLAVVESVNRAGDHAAAKRIIGTTKTLSPKKRPIRPLTSGG